MLRHVASWGDRNIPHARRTKGFCSFCQAGALHENFSSCTQTTKRSGAATCLSPLHFVYLTLREPDVVVLQRERAVALAGRREDGVEHGRRGDEDRRLADAAPE